MEALDKALTFLESLESVNYAETIKTFGYDKTTLQ